MTRRVRFVNRVFPPAPGATGLYLAEMTDALAAHGWAVDVVPAAAHAQPTDGTRLRTGCWNSQHSTDAMATVNYSVPDDVKQLFNETFAHRNKSAIVAELLLRAVEEERAHARSVAAIDRIIERRASRPTVTPQQVRAAREEGRP